MIFSFRGKGSLKCLISAVKKRRGAMKSVKNTVGFLFGSRKEK
jgi:hypothetical protein